MKREVAKELAIVSLKDFINKNRGSFYSVEGMFYSVELIEYLAEHDFLRSNEKLGFVQKHLLGLIKDWAVTYWDIPSKSSRYRKWITNLSSSCIGRRRSKEQQKKNYILKRLKNA